MAENASKWLEMAHRHQKATGAVQNGRKWVKWPSFKMASKKADGQIFEIGLF